MGGLVVGGLVVGGLVVGAAVGASVGASVGGPVGGSVAPPGHSSGLVVTSCIRKAYVEFSWRQLDKKGRTVSGHRNFVFDEERGGVQVLVESTAFR